MRNSYSAAICAALTGPNAVQIGTHVRAPLKSGEVRVAIKAAGLNFPDLLMTYGKYQFRPDPPFVPGMEFSGEVIETFKDATSFRVGDAVMGGWKGGCLAEEIVVPHDGLSPLPNALSFEEGACWRAAASTAWHALNDKASLQPEETVLILGAAGGVGMAAVKLARHLGAQVIATASSPVKQAAAREAGAEHVLDPADPQLTSKVKALTAGRGADVVFDPVGGELSLDATRAIAWGGRFLIVGFASGAIPNFPANHALIKGYSLMGLRAGESARRDPALAHRSRKSLNSLAELGIMRPHISHRFPLSESADALRVLEDRSVIGRAIVTM